MKEQSLQIDLAARQRAIDAALSQIDKQFGKGSVLRLGSRNVLPVAVISSGSISLDSALGVGGFPRGRVVEIFGPESSGKTTLALQVIAQAQRAEGRPLSSMPSTRWIPLMPRSWAWTWII